MGYRPEPPVPGLAQVGAQAPPTRRSARLARVASRARGSLLCTTWTSHLDPSLGAVKSQTGVRFSLSQRVHFRTSLDNTGRVTSGALVLAALDEIGAGILYWKLQVLPAKGDADGRYRRSVAGAGEIA